MFNFFTKMTKKEMDCDKFTLIDSETEISGSLVLNGTGSLFLAGKLTTDHLMGNNISVTGELHVREKAVNKRAIAIDTLIIDEGKVHLDGSSGSMGTIKILGNGSLTGFDLLSVDNLFVEGNGKISGGTIAYKNIQISKDASLEVSFHKKEDIKTTEESVLVPEEN